MRCASAREGNRLNTRLSTTAISTGKVNRRARILMGRWGAVALRRSICRGAISDGDSNW
jgi:hypothetical protein